MGESVEDVESVKVVKIVEAVALRPVGGWRSAALEVGGKGKIISNLKARSQETGDRIQEEKSIGRLFRIANFGLRI